MVDHLHGHACDGKMQQRLHPDLVLHLARYLEGFARKKRRRKRKKPIFSGQHQGRLLEMPPGARTESARVRRGGGEMLPKFTKTWFRG
ncbi:hypothetical protein AAC387_Pa12g2219 [Persea americana]